MDVTTRTREQTLEEQLAIFSSLADAYTNVYLIYAKTGQARVLKLNGYVTSGLQPGSQAVYDYGLTCRRYISERVHPQDRDMIRRAMDLGEVLSHLAASTEYCGSYRIVSEGETHHCQFKYARMEGADYIVAGFQNIDQIVAVEQRRQEAERARQKELEDQLAIFDILSRNYRNVYRANINDGTAKILKVAEDYDFIDVTSLKEQVFPYERVLGYWIDNRVHPEDKERLRVQLGVENLRQVLAGSKTEYTGTYRSMDGGSMHNYQFFVAKMDEAGNVIAGFQFIDDIIEEHLAQERRQREREEAYQRKLIAAKQEAERANRAKTDFLLRMSHDIRTPLNGIIGMLDVAQRCGDDLARRDDCRQKIRGATQVLLELVNEVLDMNKLESGEIVLEHVPFDLAEVIKDVHNVVMRQVEEQGIELVREGCTAPGHSLVGSPLHFKRVMTNILSNAIKYNKPNGKIYVTCREIRCEAGTSVVEFKCRDTGIGMEPEFLGHMFDPFTQEDGGSRSEYGGTGLGMSITKSLVEKMGGTIQVVSEKGMGTTVNVVVPFETGVAQPETRDAQDAAPEVSLAGLNILLAEDNELNAEIARFLLEEEGAHVTVAADGRQAVEAFADSKPGHFDAILMDVMMPRLNGYDATCEIRRMSRPDAARVPIIALTASAFAEDRLAARQAGMNEHLAKPLDTRQMMQTIARLVGAARSAGQ